MKKELNLIDVQPWRISQPWKSIPGPESPSSPHGRMKLLTVLLMEHWHKNKNYTELHQQFAPQVKSKWKAQPGIKLPSSVFTVKGFGENRGSQ